MAADAAGPHGPDVSDDESGSHTTHTAHTARTTAGPLAIRWAAIYAPEWDADPGQYVDAGLVEWGRSRRLARIDGPERAFKAYLGVQHFDPARWNAPGEAQSKFFLSLFVAGRTVALRTFPTLPDALALLAAFYAQLPLVGPLTLPPADAER